MKQKVLSMYEDFLNKERTRNSKNTAEGTYNCGGYALRTFSWYLPYRSYLTRQARLDTLMEEYDDERKIASILIQEDVSYMVDNLGGLLREVKSKRELLPNEEFIAYRLAIEFFTDGHGNIEGIDEDFHFKVLRDGKWMHKMGKTEIVECGNVYADQWDEGEGELIYFGPLRFLALKVEPSK